LIFERIISISIYFAIGSSTGIDYFERKLLLNEENKNLQDTKSMLDLRFEYIKYCNQIKWLFCISMCRWLWLWLIYETNISNSPEITALKARLLKLLQITAHQQDSATQKLRASTAGANYIARRSSDVQISETETKWLI